jgi:hypothetical protein
LWPHRYFEWAFTSQSNFSAIQWVRDIKGVSRAGAVSLLATHVPRGRRRTRELWQLVGSQNRLMLTAMGKRRDFNTPGKWSHKTSYRLHSFEEGQDGKVKRYDNQTANKRTPKEFAHMFHRKNWSIRSLAWTRDAILDSTEQSK